jgi:hypothetical protein
MKTNLLLLALLIPTIAYAQPIVDASQTQPIMQQRHLITSNVRPTSESTATSNSNSASCDSACQSAAKKTYDAAWMTECQAGGSSYATCKSEED